MKQKNNYSIPFDSIDDLFSIPKEAEGHTVIVVPLKDLFPYSNHPFRVIDDEKMDELVDSITENGVLEPAIVRSRPFGGYEIISGHRRKRACEKAGLDSMPVIVKELSDDEAAIVMVDSNNQREELLYSEKAWAYRIKYEALKHQGKKSDISSLSLITTESGKKDRQIRIYIRLTYLQEELLDMVDSKKIIIKAAEKISFLNKREQNFLLEAILDHNIYPSIDMAERLKNKSENSGLTEKEIEEILFSKKQILNGFSISAKMIQQYFPDNYTAEDMQKTIIGLLEEWNRGMKKKKKKYV